MPICLYIIIICTILFFLFKVVSNTMLADQGIITEVGFTNHDLAWKVISSYKLYYLWDSSFNFIKNSEVIVLEYIDMTSFKFTVKDTNNIMQTWHFYFDKKKNLITIKKILPLEIKWYNYITYYKNKKSVMLLASNFKKAEKGLLSETE